MSNLKLSYKKVVSTIALLLGATIGAGFASGREVLAFFRNYGYMNIVLFLITLVGLSVFTFSFIRVGKIIKVESVSELTKKVFGKFSKTLNFLISISLFISLFAMIAGLDSLAKTVLASYSFPWLSILISIITILIVSGGLKSVLKATSLIVPSIILMIFFISIYFIIFKAQFNVDFNTTMNLKTFSLGVFSSLFYIGNNLTTGGVILTQVGGNYSKKEASLTSLGFAVFFVIAASIVTLSVFISNNSIFSSDMPMIEISELISPILGIIYSTVLFLGITMTLTACAFALTNWYKHIFKSDMLTVFVIVSLGFLLSRFGFGAIIDITYPIKGALGFIFSIGVFIFYLSHEKEIKKKNLTSDSQVSLPEHQGMVEIDNSDKTDVL